MKKFKTKSRLDIRNQIEGLGWRCVDDRLWDHLDELANGVVFLAPPLDIVPSTKGNAIYTIIQDLVERAPVPCLVLSIWPAEGQPEKCSISDRILYLTRPFLALPFEKHLPHRLKKAIWGTGRPEILNYAKSAAHLCRILRVRNLVIEDNPIFGLAFQRNKPILEKIWLHQHIDAPLSLSKHWWKRVSSIYSGIIFVARKTLIDTEARHGELVNPTVVYNGVDLTHYAPRKWSSAALQLREKLGIQADETVALYAGRIIPGKGCLELARAFLSANVPGSRLIMLGNINNGLFSNSVFVEEIESVIQKSKGVILNPGNIPQSEIPAWYALSDLVVVPSIQSEGLPKVVTETLAMGKPVAATDRGGTLELVKPGMNGWLIEDPGKTNAFIALLQKMLNNKDELFKFSSYALSKDRPNLELNTKVNEFFDFILNE